MRRSPLILISPSTQKQGAEFSDVSLSLSQRYPWAILAAGGVPWVLPSLPNCGMVADCVRRCDGVMLSGGDDVQPELYSSRLSPRLRRTLGPVDPARDLMEILLINEVFRQRKPLLAICRGQQILNVALGGTLVVDIPSQLPNAIRHNRSDRKDQLVHETELAEGSLMARIFCKRQMGVNSSHHQAVGRLASPFRATARSADGIIEGLELAPAQSGWLPFLLSVQFHPERLFERHADFLELFRSFVRASQPRAHRSR